MVLKSVFASLALVAMAAPAVAQEQDKEVTDSKLYYTAMECAGAAMAMPYLKTDISQAEKDSFTTQAEFWLDIAIELGKGINADVEKDSGIAAYRLFTHLDLLGDVKAKAFYSDLQQSCNSVYMEVIKS